MPTDDSPRALVGPLRDRGWKFYAVTTSDRPERARRLTAEFLRLGVPVDVLVSDRPPDANGFASVGAWGCFASHLACLKKARAEGVTVAVFAEDDVVVTKAFGRHILSIDEQLRRFPWAMVYLGYLSPSPAVQSGMSLLSANVGRLEGWEVLGTHLYAVHASALDSLIADFSARLEPGGHRISADGVLNEYRRDNGLETLVCLPNLAHQAPSPSGITSGTGAVQALKTAVLRNAQAQAAAESVRRALWNAWSGLPVGVHAWAWSRRQRRAAG